LNRDGGPGRRGVRVRREPGPKSCTPAAGKVRGWTSSATSLERRGDGESRRAAARDRLSQGFAEAEATLSLMTRAGGL